MNKSLLDWNRDGTWKHGGRRLTNVEKKFLTDNGWVTKINNYERNYKKLDDQYY
jgi:hypothetical protein